MRNEFKRLSKRNQCEFDHKYACWSHNHNGWSKQKKLNRKMARKRYKILLRKEIILDIIRE